MTPELRITDLIPSLQQLVDLYDSVGWLAYTRDPEALAASVAGSQWLRSAWCGESLIGLIRILTDGHTIAYLQDILVRPEEQRTGVGKALMAEAADAFSHVRQFVLITDDEERQQSFYRACGFSTAAENNIHAFVKSQ